MARSPEGLSSGSFPAFEQESFECKARAHVLLQVTQSVVGELDQPRPPALLRAAARQHPAPQLDLPARDREQRWIFVIPFAATPRHLATIEFRRHLQRTIRWGAKHLF